jgi:hypothetical protein
MVACAGALGARGALTHFRSTLFFVFPLIPFQPRSSFFSPSKVRCYVGDNEQRWYLWYSARSAGPPGEGRINPPPAADAVAPGSGAVGLARSADGVVWTRGPGADTPWAADASGAAPAPVLGPNPDDWWWHDTAHVCVSDVQILSSGGVAAGAGVYWMFYSGGCWESAPPPAGLPLPPAAEALASGEGGTLASPAPLEGLRTRAGLALSQDGVHWARVEGTDHHTGAVLDAGEESGDDASAASAPWDAAFVGAPQVVAAGPRDLRLFYHSFDGVTGKWTVGVARSADGLKWERWDQGGDRGVFSGGGHAHDAAGAASRHVVRDAASGAWVMAYEAVAADGTRSIGAAVSQDGLTGWVASPVPLLAPAEEPGAWDAGGVGGPCLVPMAGGRWRLYYSGRRASGGGGGKGSTSATEGRWCGVGLALSEEGEGAAGLPGASAFPSAFMRREGGVPEGVAPVVG